MTTMKEAGNNIARAFTFAPKTIVAKAAKHQEDILRVMCILPGNYRYKQVKAAINASGVHPNDLYESLAANSHTVALARFYEALNRPQ
jgi:hypothetical protein